MRNAGQNGLMVGAAVVVLVAGALSGPWARAAASTAAPAKVAARPAATKPAADIIVPVVKSEAEWKQALTPEQFRILRQAGTEIAFTGRYWNTHAKGTYVCAACDLPLFSSATKYDSGTGWPSFWQPLAANHVATSPDAFMGQVYTEVHCARCGGHLGHVFDDGPRPTGLRYCMNSAALKFIPSR